MALESNQLLGRFIFQDQGESSPSTSICTQSCNLSEIQHGQNLGQTDMNESYSVARNILMEKISNF